MSKLEIVCVPSCVYLCTCAVTVGELMSLEWEMLMTAMKLMQSHFQ